MSEIGPRLVPDVAEKHGLYPWGAWGFIKELFAELMKDRIGLISAGIAFYGLLSLFPGIAAMMALGGLLTEPNILVDQVRQIQSVLPPDASKIIIDQAIQIVGSQAGGLGLAAVIGIARSIYCASKAVGSLVMCLHVAAGEAEGRGFVANTIFTLAMTGAAIRLALVVISSTVMVPATLAVLNVEGTIAWVLGLVRWPIIRVITALGLTPPAREVSLLQSYRSRFGLAAGYGSPMGIASRWFTALELSRRCKVCAYSSSLIPRRP